MRVVGHNRIPGPELTPSAQGLATARVHQNAGLALAAVPTTGIRHGIYRFASHEAMNRATEEALVRAIRLNVRAREAVTAPDHASEAQGTARPASMEDLKLLLRALDDNGVEYLLIGGYALYALGYQRGTVDIGIVLQPTVEQGERVRHALLVLPQGVAKDIDPAWFAEGETIRVADAFVVDLMFNACGET